MPHLKRGAIRDFKQIMADEWDENRWSKVENFYTFPNGSQIEFFSADQPGKVHGPARDRLFINEAVNIGYETARQLFVRTRGLIICDFNPTHLSWIHEHIIPRDNCVSIHSTYLDNCDWKSGASYLSAEQIAEIESNRDDSLWWRVYGEGLIGQLEGLIFPDFEQVEQMPERSDGMVETFSWDFGFANDPSVMVHALTDTRKKEIWLDELCYRKGMLNADMAAMMKEQKVSRTAPVYCDAAEPKTIEELHRYGFNTLPCYKATRKAEQLQAMRGYRMKVTKRSLNGIRELRGYVWAKDKDGAMLNEPIAVNDHFMDAARYAVFLNIRKPSEQTTRMSRT